MNFTVGRELNLHKWKEIKNKCRGNETKRFMIFTDNKK